MAKLMVRLALCAALALVSSSVRAGEEEKAPAKVPAKAPTVKTTKTEKGKESKIHVMLPTEDAKLYFDDYQCKKTGKDRSFRSPALEAGKRYSYKVVAVWVEKGSEVTHETKIVFSAGEDVAIDFRR
jgi:uncharacterized protein (TIGR03000 family)